MEAMESAGISIVRQSQARFLTSQTVMLIRKFEFQVEKLTKEKDDTITVHTVSGEDKHRATISGNNVVIWAIGRAPNTDIGLEHVVRASGKAIYISPQAFVLILGCQTGQQRQYQS